MEEPMKATSSAVGSKSKEKGSLIDEEIGKDFLSSWKSASLTQDDAMDFSFETIPKGKKKEYNFDKLDMDFNLNGDFDKLSPFKVNMADVDFSSPTKNTVNAKEKSKEESTSGKQRGKKDPFTMSFDFNDCTLDGFDFESSPKRGEKISEKTQDNKASASESSEVFKFDQTLEDDCITAKLLVPKDVANSNAEKSKLSNDVANSNAETLKPLKDVTNSKAETSKVSKDVTNSKGLAACDSLDDTRPPNAVPIRDLAPENLVAEQESRISQEKTGDINAKETYKLISLLDKEDSSQLYDQQPQQSSSLDSLSGNKSNQETVSDMQEEVCSQGRRINASLDTEKGSIAEMISDEGSIHEKLHWKNSCPLSEGDRDDRKGAVGNVPAELDDGQSVQGDIPLKDNISAASLSRELLDNSGTKKDIQNPILELPLVSSNRCTEPTPNEATARTDKEAGAIRSRFFRRSEETKSQLRQPSSTGNEISTLSSKRIGDVHLCPANEKREVDGTEAQHGRKLVDYSKLNSQELRKRRPVLLKSEENVQSPNDVGDGFDAEAAKTCGKNLIGKSSVQDKTAIKGLPILSRTEKNTSLRANPPNYAERTTESGIQIPRNPKPLVPKIDSIQNSKSCHEEALKITKKAPTFSSYKSARPVGPNKDQPDSQRETNSLRNLEQNKDTQGNASKIALPAENAEKQIPKLPSMKRKALEEMNGASMLLKPPKRFSRSPIESRNVEESCERVTEKEVQNHKMDMEVSTTDVVCDHLTVRPEVPEQVNLTEEEFPLVMENDGNAEKAEAYGKELDDICNMLKKKHEEAKEIMVRAVVNNNYLLMLNHPIYKENIKMVQKFAELLISKEMPR